jgi:hypothetical protein
VSAGDLGDAARGHLEDGGDLPAGESFVGGEAVDEAGLRVGGLLGLGGGLVDLRS